MFFVINGETVVVPGLPFFRDVRNGVTLALTTDGSLLFGRCNLGRDVDTVGTAEDAIKIDDAL